jgi:hypothetical protein
MANLEICPSCSNPLPARLMSGRVVCPKCGWTDKKKVQNNLPDIKSEATQFVDEEIPKKSVEDPIQKSRITQELVRVSNYLLIGILGILIYSQIKKPSYEYDIVSPSDLIFNESMNEYGKQGWKPVNCRRATSSGESSSASYECILVREH